MDNDPWMALTTKLIKSRQLLTRPVTTEMVIFFLQYRFLQKQRPDSVLTELFPKTLYYHPFCLFNFIQQLICPDLSHPISLIGGIIPHVSNTALFHLWGHIDVNPHLGITTQETTQQNINAKKFDLVAPCLLCVTALQRSLRHMVCLRGKETYPLAF